MGLLRKRREKDRAATDDGATSEPDIDLRVRTPEVTWGLPTRCPRCGNVGYVDKVDMVNEIMREHCPSCFHRWTVTKEELQTRR